MQILTWARSGLAAAALLSLSSCGARTIEPERICASARILPIHAYSYMITPTGRVLTPQGDGWAVSQLEVDGTLTPIANLVTSEFAFIIGGWLEHDPVSGRMWLLEGADYDQDLAPVLYQFAADGQLEWMVELVDYERPVYANSLHYHEGSLYVALTMDGVIPTDPLDPGVSYSLTLERRDLTGAVQWTRGDYQPPNSSEELASALLVGVSGSSLSMVATPPLIDYGHSFPLTVDIGTGDVLWSGEDGGDPLRMAVDEERIYLGWVTPQRHDPEAWPERVVVAPTASSLAVHDPSSGAQQNLDAVEWEAIEWVYPDSGGQDFAMGWMGAELVSVIASGGEHGVTVHDRDGTLLCQGALELEFDRIGQGIGIEGRRQFLASVGVTVGEGDEAYEEWGLLLIEPLDD